MRKVAFLLSMIFFFTTVEACNDCDEIKDEASQLKENSKRCEEGDLCTVLDMGDLTGTSNCLQGFQCAFPINENANIDGFIKKVKSLEKDFDNCGECSMASCGSPSSFNAECNVDSEKCVLVPTSEP